MTVPKAKPAAQTGGHTPTERSWIPILADWKKSGLGVREFCRRRRVRESTFWFWRKEVPERERRRRERRADATGNRRIRILPVRVVETPASKGPIEILSGGRTLRVAGDFDPVILRKVLSVLEGPR